MVFPRSGKAAHENDLTAKRLMRSVMVIFLASAEPEKARVVRGKRERRVEAAVLAAVLAKELDVEKNALLVGAHPSACICLGDERERRASRRLADLSDETKGILSLERPEWRLVVADVRDDRFTRREGNAETPKDGARRDRSLHR